MVALFTLVTLYKLFINNCIMWVRMDMDVNKWLIKWFPIPLHCSVYIFHSLTIIRFFTCTFFSMKNNDVHQLLNNALVYCLDKKGVQWESKAYMGSNERWQFLIVPGIQQSIGSLHHLLEVVVFKQIVILYSMSITKSSMFLELEFLL